MEMVFGEVSTYLPSPERL